MLRGYSLPRTPSGGSSLVSAPADTPDLVVSLAGATPTTKRTVFAEVVAAAAQRSARTAALSE